MCGWRMCGSRFSLPFWLLERIAVYCPARLTFLQLSLLALLLQKVFVQASLECLQSALFSDFEGESFQIAVYLSVKWFLVSSGI